LGMVTSGAKLTEDKKRGTHCQKKRRCLVKSGGKAERKGGYTFRRKTWDETKQKGFEKEPTDKIEN